METYRANLYQLAVFAAVIEQASLTRAAEAFRVSQPVVSRIVRSLEHEYGSKLTQRSGPVLAPTTAGEIIYSFAKDALRAHNHARQAIRDMASSMNGRLRIGVTSAAHERAAPHVARLLSRYARAEVDVRVESSLLVADGVRDGDLDAGIVISFAESEANLTAISLWTDDLAVVAAPDHPVTAEEAPPEAWHSVAVIATASDNHLAFLKDNFIPLLPSQHKYQIIQCGSPQFVCQLVTEGAGVTALPLVILERAIADGKLVRLPLSAKIAPIQLKFIQNPHVEPSPLLREFRQLLGISIAPGREPVDGASPRTRRR